jgi:hypothetical protein
VRQVFFCEERSRAETALGKRSAIIAFTVETTELLFLSGENHDYTVLKAVEEESANALERGG